ncbi:PREDICTED: BAG domain-containing protein Samui isoform X2 [Polistes dominula]|uniref:BAG domain-containing protein Samui isoform X2 n=1 Tax=Polistes dominula TaxID=743375 RepID=A0ABM1I6K2_POLDO|nr:PREDICTED: BAG domain-containing protein Samui isoform X2 [Polistes dominula]
MDSPVIVDTASKFGQGIPGFPFDDDDDFGRRTDIRAHLDDLAARHPEFADHLLGPPWGDIPFRGSTYNNQRRGSGNGGSSSYPNYPDEDARSQASGSSATSAASGASGVSSHGDPESSSSSSSNRSKNPQYKQSHREDRRNPIPQYGLRNTVDIGQHHRDNMENSEKDSRGQRSMSAPPENRQQTNLQQEQDKSQQQPTTGQRYVSRVDITPQHNQPQSSPSQQQSSPAPPPPPTQPSQGNVRHIPIFVEGRDEPVISKNIDAPFQRQQSPPQFHNSPHFNKPSSFSNLGFGPRQWRPHFQESFYNPNSSFDHSPTRRTQSPSYQQPKHYAERQQQPSRNHQYESQPQEYHQPRQRARQQQEPKPHPQQQTAPGPQAQQQEAPKHVPKQTLPKDPLERVASVQKEVDSLAEQVKQYTGNSRKDKQYMFLDEMLTRELIKLDDIETEGRENVRQARKNAIRTIQETISLLESKAPLPGQEQSQEDSQSMQVELYQEQDKENQPSNEPMDVDQNNEQNMQSNEAIPLPPGPSSPKTTTESNEGTVAVAQIEPQNVSTENQQTEQKQEVPPAANQAEQQEQQQQLQQEAAVVADKPSNENTNNITEVTMQIDSSAPMEVQEKVENVVEEEKKDENQNVSKEIKMVGESVEQKSTEEQKQISDSQEKTKSTTKLPLSPKTAKKAKKLAAPISEKAIPLPPPESTEANAK